MRASFAARALLGLGLTVGVAATVAWFAGFDPNTLPPELLKIAAYKLTALAAFGLIGAGAVMLRYARRAEIQESQVQQPLADSVPAALRAADNLSNPEFVARERTRDHS